jgi:two-component system phosphate regulon sensor histidine kinase PhoR
MKQRSFFWHVLPPFLLVILVACIAVLGYAMQSYKSLHHDTTFSLLRTRAMLLSSFFTQHAPQSRAALDSLVKSYGSLTGTRITIIDSSGLVLADSHENPATMDNHRDRPEIRDALRGDTGTATRYSETLSHDLMYVAVPLNTPFHHQRVLRTAVPLVAVSESLGAVSSRILIVSIIVFLAALVLSMLISHRLSTPLRRLTQGAQRFANGDFSDSLPLSVTREVSQLTDAMGQMARQLDDRIRALTRANNEQNAVLSAMVEGVVAVDQDEHIIMLNAAAGKILGIAPDKVKGKWIQEVIRNTQLQALIRQLLENGGTLESEFCIETTSSGATTIEVHGTELIDARKGLSGGLLVLHDVTSLKKLENIRRDFVANVSHELRTPLTSIKGFVETLLDGALNEPKSCNRFLGIIDEHVNRLNSLIEDLLTISRLEREETIEQVEFETTPLAASIKAAIKVCQPKADDKSIGIQFDESFTPIATVNASLIEQAIINLVDNSIKYSDAGSRIRVWCERSNEELRIHVADEGMGIAPEHVPRLFERFYRVDKARSRKVGGTGLGLAIVKHIMGVHHGSVTVLSTIGKGSTFTLHLPLSVSQEIVA